MNLNNLHLVLCNLVNTKYDSLSVVRLYIDHGFTLEQLSKDIYDIIIDTHESALTYWSFIEDVVNLNNFISGSEYTDLEIINDINNLLFNIFYRYRQIEIPNKTLMSLYLEQPDTIVFQLSNQNA